MKLRIAGTVNDSIVDGPGIRFTVFTQGCPHHCEGCHNPQTHDFNGGSEADTDEIISKFLSNPLLDGITLSGGEPMCQAKALVPVAKAAKEHGLNVITYTGYTYEQLIDGANETNGWRDLLEYVDFLIDGRFELGQRSLELHFKGSKNQRVIDIKSSLDEGHAVLADWN